ncbi:MAG: alpha/beta fold hydrolase [Elusimicrobia bacterium]|nr:alpha/beta fold hydrolase [Elusimicrobiota bacterium]
MNFPCAAARIAALAVLAAAAAPVVHFQTPDGWTLAARYRAPRRGRTVVVMAHGVAAGKDEWEPLAALLAGRGIGSLALDLRGHGESRTGPRGPQGFEGFDAYGEWPKSAADFTAAAAFLKKRGVAPDRIAYAGASIGANLAARAGPRPRFLVLLSPGMDYRGVGLPRPEPGRPALVAASPQDGYAFRTAAAYAAANPAARFLKAKAGHGAQMFSDPAFLNELADWIERH